MGGRRVNAKVKQVGFHLDTSKEGIVFSRARWLKCSDFSVGFFARGFCTCVCFAPASKLDLVLLKIEEGLSSPTLMWNRWRLSPFVLFIDINNSFYPLFFSLSFFLLVQRCPCLFVLIDDEWSYIFILYFVFQATLCSFWKVMLSGSLSLKKNKSFGQKYSCSF